MELLDLSFRLLCTALALYFSYIRFQARLPVFGHAMMATALLDIVFYLHGLELLANVAAATFVLLYIKSLSILHQYGLGDGSR